MRVLFSYLKLLSARNADGERRGSGSIKRERRERINMLEWLKTILGDNYSEEIDTAISGEIGKGFVSKANYDQRNTAYKDLQKQIAERDTQLEELKKVDTAKLQEEIVKLQATNKTAKEDYEKKIADLQKEYAVDTALNKVGARNIKAVKALLDNSKIELKEDGSLTGLNEQLDVLSKAEDSSFLFGTGGKGKANIDGFHPAQGTGANEGKPDLNSMTYQELDKYLTEHPGEHLPPTH